MRVSKEKAAQNRVAILDAASRLFRKRGIDGVGVAEIAKEAGLTHGALYAHFASKDALVAEAFSHGFQGNMAKVRARTGNQRPSFEDHLGGLLSTRTRDNLEKGCPLAASASEIGRQGDAVSSRFTQAFGEMVALFEDSLEAGIPASRKRRLAIAAVAAQIGAIAVSRAVAKTDSALADEVLQSVHQTVAASATS
jgi:TetR/AcrR family transcriptional repressor of nem operon